MKLTFDLRHNVAYLRLQEKTTGVETLQVSEDLNIDIAPDGTVYGIEFLNAREQIVEHDGGRLLVTDAALGETKELSLTHG